MLIKRAFLLCFLLISSVAVFAQSAIIESEIQKHTPGKGDLVAKGRNYLLHKIKQNDRAKVKELFEFLLIEESKGTVAFYSEEKVLMSYWTLKFDTITTNAVDTYNKRITELIGAGHLNAKEYYQSHPYYFTQDNEVIPDYVELYRALKDTMIHHKLDLITEIKDSHLLAQDQDFLILNLEHLLSQKEKSSSRDSLLVHANAYLQRFPESKYNDYIKQYIYFEYVPNKFSQQWDIGVGYSAFTGELSKKFRDVNVYSFAFKGNYQRLGIGLKGSLGILKNMETIKTSEFSWEHYTKLNQFMFEGVIGYSIYANSKYNLEPYLGIGLMSIMPNSTEEDAHAEYKDTKIGFSKTYILGASFDYYLGSNSSKGAGSSERPFIRLRYSYNMPQLSPTYTGFTGNFHSITLGFGVGFRGSRRGR